MLVFLLLIGRWIQFRQQHRAASAVDLLLRITPQHANLVDPQAPDAKPRLVLVDVLRTGPAGSHRRGRKHSGRWHRVPMENRWWIDPC